jgi:hypothetical protein
MMTTENVRDRSDLERYEATAKVPREAQAKIDSKAAKVGKRK